MQTSRSVGSWASKLNWVNSLSHYVTIKTGTHFRLWVYRFTKKTKQIFKNAYQTSANTVKQLFFSVISKVLGKPWAPTLTEMMSFKCIIVSPTQNWFCDAFTITSTNKYFFFLWNIILNTLFSVSIFKLLNPILLFSVSSIDESFSLSFFCVTILFSVCDTLSVLSRFISLCCFSFCLVLIILWSSLIFLSFFSIWLFEFWKFWVSMDFLSCYYCHILWLLQMKYKRKNAIKNHTITLCLSSLFCIISELFCKYDALFTMDNLFTFCYVCFVLNHNSLRV